MEVSVETRERFEPVIFKVTCNTESDLKLLWSALNTCSGDLLKRGKDIRLKTEDIKLDNDLFWSVVNKECKKLGLLHE